MAKYIVQYNGTKIDEFMLQHDMRLVSPRTLQSAINACSKGVVSLGLDPKTAELIIAVNGKYSPATERLAIEVGYTEKACALLHICGAAIDDSAFQMIRDYL